MKRILTSMLLFFVVSHAIIAQNNSDEEQLKALVQNSFDRIFSDMEVDRIPNYFTNDFLLLEQGEVWDLDKLKAMLTAYNNGETERINSFEFIHISMNGQTAWIAYHNKARFKRDDKFIGEMNWLESATAIKTEDGWKIDMLHSTKIAETK